MYILHHRSMLAATGTRTTCQQAGSNWHPHRKTAAQVLQVQQAEITQRRHAFSSTGASSCLWLESPQPHSACKGTTLSYFTVRELPHYEPLHPALFAHSQCVINLLRPSSRLAQSACTHPRTLGGSRSTSPCVWYAVSCIKRYLLLHNCKSGT
jgi:hypothetical protein